VSITVEHDYELTALNTFGVASVAQTYIRVTDDADFPEAVDKASVLAGYRGVFVLGGGSNVLLTQPYNGCVLHVDTKGMRELEENVVEAMAGESWHRFVMWTLERGYCGLENLSLIYGTVGGAPIQNIGAYGVELRETFHSCDVISRNSGETKRLSAEDCRFGYRDSLFKSFVGKEWIVRRVRLKLSRTPALRLAYGDVKNELLAQGKTEATPMDVSRAVQIIRTRKLPDPVLLGNAGSFFKNPVIPAAQFDDLKLKYPAIPHYPDLDGWVKLPAAWLIDQCGLKGIRRGAAGVHAQHALVLVNHGGATGAQIWALAQEIIGVVEAKFQITLQPEPIVL
jgi:UDP-N-acetylmuramate dehydrogenase